MKMKIVQLLLLLLTLQFNSSAQILPGAKQISLSHSDIALSHDVMAHFNNPAGLAQLNWSELGIYYSPAPFGLSELANGFAAYHHPTTLGHLSVGIMTYGFELYTEKIISFGYAKRFYKDFLLGIRTDYRSLSIKRYGSTNNFSFTIGGIAYITNYLRTGFTINNITRSSYSDEKNQIPTTLQIGFSLDLEESIIANIALEKELGFTPSLNFGLDYLIIPYINLRFGFRTLPSSFSAGIGVNYNLIEVDYATFNHQDLGFTHQAGIILHFSSSESRLKKIKEYLGYK